MTKGILWSKVFYTLLISYIAMLILPTCISTIMYHTALDSFEKQTVEMDRIILNYVSETLDERLNRIKNMSYEISSKQDIRQLQWYSRGGADQSLLLKSAVQDINALHAINSGIVEFCAVYLKNSGTILSTDANYTIAEYYDAEIAPRGVNLSYAEFQQRLDTPAAAGFYKMERATGSPLIYFVRDLPLNGFETRGKVLLFVSSEKEMFDIDHILVDSDKTLCVFDGENSLLYPGKSEIRPAEEQYTPQLQNWTNPSTGINYIVSSVSSHSSPWSYAVFSSASSYMAELIRLRRIVVFSVASTLLLGLATAYLFSRRSYRPVSHIYQAISEGLGRGPVHAAGKRENEYDTILNGISEMADEKRKLGVQVTELQPLVRGNLLKTLLQDEITSASAERLAQKLEIPINAASYFVLSIDCTGLPPDFPERLYGWCDTHLRGSVMAEDTPRCILLLCIPDRESPEEALDRRLLAMRDFWNELHIAPPSMGIGMPCQSLVELHEIYRQSSIALQYKFIRGKGKIVYFRDLPKSGDSRYQYSTKSEMEIINNMKAGNVDKALQLVDQIIDENFSNRSITLNMAQCLAFDLMSTTNKTIWEVCHSDDSTIQFKEIFGQLVQCETLEELHLRVRSVFREIGCYIGSYKRSHNSDLMQQVLDYIDAHYGDESLSLGSLADAMGLSPQYLSRFFKEQTGRNFLDYLSEYRIKKAKQLLAVGSYSIKSVAESVGYSNPKNLTRVFKKREGITPAEYRTFLK